MITAHTTAETYLYFPASFTRDAGSDQLVAPPLRELEKHAALNVAVAGELTRLCLSRAARP